MADTIPTLLGVAAIWVVAVLSPGPAFLVVVDSALRQGRAVALRTVVGLSCGTMAWGVAGFFGVAFLFAAAPWTHSVLKVVGGGYLIYLGIRALAGEKVEEAVIDTGEAASKAWRRGLLTNLTNPKAAAFVASVYATTMPTEPSIALGAAAIMIMVSITATWYSVVAVTLTTSRIADLYSRGRRWIERVTGLFLIGFGAKMIADR